MPYSHRLRMGRASETGRTYHCTCAVPHRDSVFTSLRLGRIVVRAMRAMDARGASNTLAFVAMPDHVHWLFTLGEGAELAAVLRGVKQWSAHQVNVATGRRGRLWQPGFHERAIRKEEDVREIARYIVFNPVRAGLVKSVREYALWDAMWL